MDKAFLKTKYASLVALFCSTLFVLSLYFSSLFSPHIKVILIKAAAHVVIDLHMATVNFIKYNMNM